FAITLTDIERMQKSSVWKMAEKKIFDDMLVPVEVVGVNRLGARSNSGQSFK
ncbi:MAG: hypothetical protein RLY14_2249, partial [Planctomycetota bacterium]